MLDYDVLRANLKTWGKRRGDILRELGKINREQKTLTKKYKDLTHEHGCLGVMWDEVRKLLIGLGQLKETK